MIDYTFINRVEIPFKLATYSLTTTTRKPFRTPNNDWACSLVIFSFAERVCTERRRYRRLLKARWRQRGHAHRSDPKPSPG